MTCGVCGDKNLQNVLKWCHEFMEGRADIHDEPASWSQSVVSHDYRCKVLRNVEKLENCLFFFAKLEKK